MAKITAVLIGAGARGMGIYGEYALKRPHDIQFVGVADPDDARREKFAKAHNIDEKMSFKCWEDMLDKPKLADAVLVCTQDRMHFKPAVRAMEKGYHILMEKPMTNDPIECILLGEYAQSYDRVLSVCHVLRYTAFFETVKKILDEGRIGRLISIQHNENVAYWHYSHSYVRGNWRNSQESSPMILAKSCHDMDIMLWLAGADCKNISSFGYLTHFKSENAPLGAPLRCLDGCPHEKSCPYYAPKIYIEGETAGLAYIISNDTGFEAWMNALKTGPYGRCVYHCDNDVVDHQVVNIEFENEVTAAFTMCAFTQECNRTLKLMGTKGELRGAVEKNEIEILDFATGNKETIYLKPSQYGHGGGDYGIMYDFVRLVRSGGKEGLTSARTSVQSHVMAFAAEQSRIEKRIVSLEEYIEKLKAKNRGEL